MHSPVTNIIGESTTTTNPSKSPALPYSLILKPEEYETLALENPVYATYIFLPSVGLFAHPLAVPPELAPASFIPLPSTVSTSNMCPLPTSTRVTITPCLRN